ncbi:hypothetical protein Tco_0770048 [Tanacetum coccineum]|uniref:Uncharacterized protein n=1 Tax=Tanacetum coccineum TaxID=301880 RepID=A0ABQ4ZE23_9ASTR
MLCRPKSFYDEKHRYHRLPTRFLKENLIATLMLPIENLTPRKDMFGLDATKAKAETLALKPCRFGTVFHPQYLLSMLVTRIIPTKKVRCNDSTGAKGSKPRSNDIEEK